MKKTAFYAFMMAALVGTSFTACHDDDDDEDGSFSDTQANFANTTIDASIIGKASGQLGLETYVLTSDEGIDVYSYSTLPQGTIIENYFDENGHITPEGIAALGENFYGGFTPTWQKANNSDEENPYAYLLPANKSSYNSGSSALICNPGLVCRAFFSKHLGLDAKSLQAAGLIGDAKYLYVSPIAIYNELETGNEEGLIENYVALPADNKIQVVVYGYVDSFDVTNLNKTLNSFKGAFASATSGGTLCADIKDIAVADGEGKVTVNKEWQKIDLSSLSDYYLFEIDIRVVGKDGKTNKDYELSDDLKLILVDDITFESKGIGGLISGISSWF